MCDYIYVIVIEFFDNILHHYSWQGIALSGVLLLLFFVQLYYYAIAYYRIYRYRLMRRRKKIAENPPISVIVAVRGENEAFLTEELPVLLHQEYDPFEVVVVYVGGDIDYYDELQRIRDNYSNMRLTRMGGDSRIYISTKQALNVGIKSAQYDALLFTTTGAIPRSEQWVALMSKGFERGMVVAAPAVPQFEHNNLKTFLMRMVEFQRERNAMACAVNDRLYYAPRSNYGYTRHLYESTRGFNHLGIDIGDNDLYLQAIATPERTAVVLSRHSIVVEERPERWSEWMELMRYYSSTREHYPATAKTFARRELGSRVLFMLATITAVVVLPLELKLGAIGLLLLRYLIVVGTSRRVAMRMGQKGIVMRYWIYDLLGPAVEWMIGSKHSHNTPKLWR